MLTVIELRTLLAYAPATGDFTWLSRDRAWFKTERAWKIWNARFAGKPAGGDNGVLGYRKITVMAEQYWGHRLAWLYMTGVWPAEEVDHIDRDGLNNRWGNLRAATKSQQQQNSVRHNPSGYKGAILTPRRKKPWAAAITIDGAAIHLGKFKTASEAGDAYAVKARELFGGFARVSDERSASR